MNAEVLINNEGHRDGLKPPLDTLLAGKFVVDVNKLDMRTQIDVISVHNNYGFSDHIDKELYDKLQAMDIGHYGEELRQRTKLNEAQILMAQVKLKIAELERDGGVYTEENWKDETTLKKINASAETVPIGVAIDNYNNAIEEKMNALGPKNVKEQFIDLDQQKKAMSVQADYYAKTGFYRFAGLSEE